ncbi:hypothetical protein P7K49_009640 [Saguinus oedipus]|uniref:beta-D-galactosyl-(1->3)-N-acetyl-beta-D-galactosaminide alpha-2,3-sialyltransferase n=1 Tax=Saguinus oedipus TaxID=9490 RepID=A0ABQ9VKK1_SAGOE|nr:hypothetical protein P7K49_009640 [Saguinus oedipus]
MPGESDWFDRCFDSTVEPLQRPQDPVSNDALILWLVLAISLYFFRYIQESWMENYGQYLSLGFVALFYALHTCDQVSLFGFGADNHKRWSHYWDGKYWCENTMQNFPAEYQIILKLQCERKIAVYS